MLNSNFVSAQDRKRLYWTNIPSIVQPHDKGLTLKDIMQAESEKQEYQIFNRMQAKALGTLAHHKTWSNVRGLDQKSKTLTCGQSIANSGATNVKYSDTSYYKLTPLECERLQTLPDNYTQGLSDTQRYKCVGNGWTVDIIAHILSFSKTAVVAEPVHKVEAVQAIKPITEQPTPSPAEQPKTITLDLNGLLALIAGKQITITINIGG